MRLIKIPGGQLQIAEPGGKNRKSLEGLGLDVLMSIEPSDSVWGDRISEIRHLLKPYVENSGQVGGAPHVLEAHLKLCEADEKNSEKFGTVLEFLEAEVNAKKEAE